MLVQILLSTRSEAQLIELLCYILLLQWFVGFSIDEPVWVPSGSTKNGDRLLNADFVKKVMAVILAHENVVPLLSDDAGKANEKGTTGTSTKRDMVDGSSKMMPAQTTATNETERNIEQTGGARHGRTRRLDRRYRCTPLPQRQGQTG